MNIVNKKRYSKRQEHVITAVSAAVLALAAAIVMTNITTGAEHSDRSGIIGRQETENMTGGGETASDKEIAGITADKLDSTEKTAAESEGTSKNHGNAQEENTIAAQVVSKEYNNVTSGRLEETPYVKSEYFDDTVFLGDSRTAALRNHGFIRPENTFAINGISHVTFLTQEFTDTVTGTTGDIFDIVRVRKPKRIYVALGVNGVAFIQKSEFVSKYNELIEGLINASPGSSIIIQCILPVNENTYTGGNANLNNKNIDDMNGELLDIAESHGVYYLDIADILKNDNGQLSAEADGGDGLHFSLTGYSTVYDGICRHGVD